MKASKAPAISRAVAVLRLLGSAAEPWGMQAIARELGMVPSTCHYVLRALLAEELISFDPITKRYAAEVGVFVPSRLRVRCNRFADGVIHAMSVHDFMACRSSRSGHVGPAREVGQPQRLPWSLFHWGRRSRVAQARLSVRKIREILRLRAEGYSEREIARSVGVARSSIPPKTPLLKGGCYRTLSDRSACPSACLFGN